MWRKDRGISLEKKQGRTMTRALCQFGWLRGPLFAFAGIVLGQHTEEPRYAQHALVSGASFISSAVLLGFVK